MKLNTMQIVSLAAFLAVQGCGGGGGGSSSKSPDPVPPQTQTGSFIDSPVINVGYRTQTKQGVTNAQGQYDYIAGETVTFFIGDLEFPPVAAAGTVTPLDLAGTSDTANSTVVNIVRLLQTLDQDGDPDNGISITDAAKTAATQVDFTLSESAFEALGGVSNLIANGGQTVAVTALVDTADAVSHFEDQLADRGIAYGSIVGVWQLTGRPAVHIGESDLCVVVFLPNGDYYMMESNEINEGDGFEHGTYTFNNGVLSITTLGDTNDDIGFSTMGSAAAHLPIHLEGGVYTFESADNRESGIYTFTKQVLSETSVGGAWLSGDGHALFVFLQNGQYLGLQSEEENGFVGFEWGSYDFDGSSLTVSTIDNSDGEALLCDEPAGNECQNVIYAASAEGGTLTLTVPEEGDFVFTDQFGS